MERWRGGRWVTWLALALVLWRGAAQTDGTARLSVTLGDYNGSGTKHWTVVWVTTESGAFVKTLWKQGTKYAFSSSQWTTHCPQWNTARGGSGGSTIVDGYTSATATSYSGTNSPIILAWNGRNTNNALVPDGRYKFWVQYAEDESAAGPYTVGGLLWTKGGAAVTNTYANQGANFTGMRVSWTPTAPATVAPAFTSLPPASAATVGVPYAHTCVATGTAPIVFKATGLPSGLALSPEGVLAGTPTVGGSFAGQITAANGTAPDATQSFSIVVNVVPATIATATIAGDRLILAGTGPAGGRYSVLVATDPRLALSDWAVVANGLFDAQGGFAHTNAISPVLPGSLYTLRVP